MGRSQTGGARARATPSAEATVAVHKRWFKKVISAAPYFFPFIGLAVAAVF